MSAVLKWEARKWLHHIGIILLIPLGCWVLMHVPLPGAHWDETLVGSIARGAILWVAMGAGLLALICVLYMLFVYPMVWAFGSLYKSTLLEHGSKHTSALRLCTRLAGNVLTFALGMGVAHVTLRIGQRFRALEIGWLNNLLAEGELYVLWEMLPLIAVTTPLILRMGMMFMNVGGQELKWRETLPATLTFFAINLFIPGITQPRFIENMVAAWPVAVGWAVWLGLLAVLIVSAVHITDRYGEVNV